MSTSTADRLVGDYLHRLAVAAASLAPERRTELLDGIGEHIEAARADGSAADEVGVRSLLDRLGEPEEIVAAAREQAPAQQSAWPPPGVVARRPGTGLELAAVVMLTVGSLLPILGWLIGAVLLWVSRRWTLGEKLLGTLVVPGGPMVVLYLTAMPTGSLESCRAPLEVGGAPSDAEMICTSSGFSLPIWLGLPVFLLLLLGPFVVGALLLRRARVRAELEPPMLREARPVWGGLEIAAVLLLALGSIALPLLGPVIGIFLVWSSDRWTRHEKQVATWLAVVPTVVLFALPILGILFARSLL